MFFGKNKIIGLDIGSTSIKVAELDLGRKGASLISFASIPTRPESMSGGDLLDPEAISESIRSLLAEIKTKRKAAATGISGSAVVIKRITIPKMDEGLVAEQIRWEAEQYIPYDVNEVNLGFQILKNAGASSDSMDILLIAAVQESVFRYAEAIEMSGISCSVIDVSGFALANCFEQNYGVDNDVVALLNVGATATNFVIVDNGEIIFCRDIPVGGNTYTGEIQKGMGISRDEAESMKISACNGFEAPDEVNSILQSTHEIITDEVSSSIDFFLNTNNASAVTRGFVTGGCVRVPGIVEQLSSVLPCERLDPFFGISYNEKVFSREYIDEIRDFASVVVGLGLRKAGDS